MTTTTSNKPNLKPLPDGRIRVSNAPVALPGQCVVCGSPGGDDRVFIDFGFDIEFYGVVYFCSYCITEVANSLGLLSSEQGSNLIEQLDAARVEILRITSENRRLRDAMAILSDGDSVTPVGDQPSAGISGAETEQVLEQDSSAGEKPESNSGKSSDKPRSDDVSGATGDIFTDLAL